MEEVDLRNGMIRIPKSYQFFSLVKIAMNQTNLPHEEVNQAKDGALKVEHEIGWVKGKVCWKRDSLVSLLEWLPFWSSLCKTLESSDNRSR